MRKHLKRPWQENKFGIELRSNKNKSVYRIEFYTTRRSGLWNSDQNCTQNPAEGEGVVGLEMGSGGAGVSRGWGSRGGGGGGLEWDFQVPFDRPFAKTLAASLNI